MLIILKSTRTVFANIKILESRILTIPNFSIFIFISSTMTIRSLKVCKLTSNLLLDILFMIYVYTRHIHITILFGS